MEVCPRCGERKLNPDKVLNSLSRRDNETYICNDCGMDEAFTDFLVSEAETTLPKDAENKKTWQNLGFYQMLERAWLTEQRPLNEILGRPWVPLVQTGVFEFSEEHADG